MVFTYKGGLQIMQEEKDFSQFRFEKKREGNSPKVVKKLPRHKAGGKFLKGPIPRKWLEEAAKLPGKALHVAIELWFWAGIVGPCGIRLKATNLMGLGVKRHAGYRAINKLEAAGLISVTRIAGRKLVIDLNDISSAGE